VTTEKQRTLIDGRSGNGVDAAGGTQLHRRFDVTAGSFAGGARFDSRFDETTDVVEMINDGFGMFRKGLVCANDVVAGLEIECARGVSEHVRVAEDHRNASASDFFCGDSLENDLGPN